jgi:hypothetical protein
MSYQEKKNIVSLISTFLIFGSYCLYVFGLQRETYYASINELSYWASVILILIPVSVAAKIVISIVFSIVYRTTSGEKEPSFMDELDKLIDLKATRNSYYVFIIGFLLAMGALAASLPPYVTFLTLLGFGFLAEVTAVVTQLYLYRKGV